MTLNDLEDYRALKQELNDISTKTTELDRFLQNEEDPVLVKKRSAVRALYKHRLSELEDLTLTIERAIRELPSTYRVIMRLYYIDGLTWEEVADKTNYCDRQLRRIRDKALDKMSLNVLPK